MAISLKAILVCVDYHDILSLTLPDNALHFESVTVVTTPADKKTQEVVSKIPNAQCHLTDTFYAHDCAFNKGAAMEEGFDVMGRDGWIVVLDADIVLPPHMHFPALDTQQIYGVHRRMLEDVSLYAEGWYHKIEEWKTLSTMNDTDIAVGFFQLFHASANHLSNRPWYPVEWKHAGGCDSFFERKWSNQNRIRLFDFQVLHLGTPGRNWFGRTTPFLDGTLHEESEKRFLQLADMIENRKKGLPNYMGERLPPI